MTAIPALNELIVDLQPRAKRTVETVKANEARAKHISTLAEAAGFRAIPKSIDAQIKTHSQKTATERKEATAEEFYPHITWSQVQKFQNKLRSATSDGYSYKQLEFTPLHTWNRIPPESVLLEVKKAQESQLFNAFWVAHIVDVKDPIVFARVSEGSNKYFMIAQWGDDVTIEEIMAAE